MDRRAPRAADRVGGPRARRGAADQGPGRGSTAAEAARRGRFRDRRSTQPVQHHVPGRHRDRCDTGARHAASPPTRRSRSCCRRASRRSRSPTCRSSRTQPPQAALGAKHLSATRGTDVFSNDVPKGLVISTLPAAGQLAPYGSTVAGLPLARPDPGQGPRPHRRHAVGGRRPRSTTAHGLGISINGSEHGNDVVVDQTPKPGAMVPLETTTVTLTFGPSLELRPLT